MLSYYLPYREKKYKVITPVNEKYFTLDEIKHLLEGDNIKEINLLSKDRKLSGLNMLINDSFMQNVERFNLMATRALMKGHFTSQFVSINIISMAIDINRYYNDNPNIKFIGGNALILSPDKYKLNNV